MKLYYAEIFEILSKGRFISSNSTDSENRLLYKHIEDNYNELRDYFEKINFRLESGNEYFYFSRMEKRVDMERKLKAMRKWIDWLDFLKSYDNTFASGYIFSQADIESRVKVDLDLKEKLRAMSPSQLNISQMLKKLVDDLKNEGFVELENDFEGRYKVMAAFNYAEELILSINIPEEIENEIFE